MEVIRQNITNTIIIDIRLRTNLIFFYSHHSSTIDACTSLHEKWQQHHRTWFSSNLAESENKLVLAEENWRRSRLITNYGTSVSINGQSLDKSYPQRNLRDLMEELRSSSSHGKNKPKSPQSQSDYTTADLMGSSESDLNDNEDEDEANHNQPPVPSYRNQDHPKTRQEPSINQRNQSTRSHIAQRKKLPTPSPTSQVLGVSTNRHRTDSKSSLDDSVYSSLSNDVYSKINVPTQHQPKQQVIDNNIVPFTPDTSCTPPFSPIMKHSQHEGRTPQFYKKGDQYRI